jgi:hypothetical protein
MLFDERLHGQVAEIAGEQQDARILRSEFREGLHECGSHGAASNSAMAWLYSASDMGQ